MEGVPRNNVVVRVFRMMRKEACDMPVTCAVLNIQLCLIHMLVTGEAWKREVNRR